MLYDELDVPEARFGYNLSPMAVLVKSEKRPWYDFITKVLAIVGGTFSVVRKPWVSSLFYSSCEGLMRVVSWGQYSFRWHWMSGLWVLHAAPSTAL